MTWTDNSVLEIETRIERIKDSTGTFGEIGRTGVDTISYVDSTLELGHTYFYRVRVYTADRRFSGYSNIAAVVVPTSASSQNAVRREPDADAGVLRNRAHVR